MGVVTQFQLKMGLTLIRRSLADYLEKLRIESEFDPVGFGMWEGRIEMQDSTKWVQGLRSQEWDR